LEERKLDVAEKLVEPSARSQVYETYRVQGEEKYEYAIACIIDRLKIYWNDYVITDLEEDLNVDKYNDWNELYKLAKEKYGKDVDNNTILGYLLDSSNIYIEEITQGGKV
jgi:hypothetical protein